MLNTALIRTRYEFNDFTYYLAERCMAEGCAEVILRNNDKITVLYERKEEYDGLKGYFRTENWHHVWHRDGSSVESESLDIVEL